MVPAKKQLDLCLSPLSPPTVLKLEGWNLSCIIFICMTQNLPNRILICCLRSRAFKFKVMWWIYSSWTIEWTHAWFWADNMMIISSKFQPFSFKEDRGGWHRSQRRETNRSQFRVLRWDRYWYCGLGGQTQPEIQTQSQTQTQAQPEHNPNLNMLVSHFSSFRIWIGVGPVS